VLISLITISCEQAYYIDAPAHPDKEKIITIINEQRSKGCKCGDDYYPAADPVK
jgi:hypothetical protein